MDELDKEDFDRFVERHWKKVKKTVPVSAEVEEVPTRKRGRKPKIQQ